MDLKSPASGQGRAIPPASTEKQLKAAMQGHILAKAQLMDTNRRKKAGSSGKK